VPSWAPGLNWAFNPRMNKSCIRPKNKWRPFSCVASQQFSSFQGKNTTDLFSSLLVVATENSQGDHSLKFSSTASHWDNFDEVYRLEMKCVSKRRYIPVIETIFLMSYIYCTLLKHIMGPRNNELKRVNLLSPCYFPKH
jgi:hypothetical protein